MKRAMVDSSEALSGLRAHSVTSLSQRSRSTSSTRNPSLRRSTASHARKVRPGGWSSRATPDVSRWRRGKRLRDVTVRGGGLVDDGFLLDDDDRRLLRCRLGRGDDQKQEEKRRREQQGEQQRADEADAAPAAIDGDKDC